MNEQCVFCDIVAGRQPATLVYGDDLTIAFLDLRQYHPGHTLVIPRRHIHDVRDLDDVTGAAVMTTVCRITRAVAAAFQNDGLSLWHSIGPGAFQEIPHLHFHIHPRLIGDDLLRVYPGTPRTSDEAARAAYAQQLRARL